MSLLRVLLVSVVFGFLTGPVVAQYTPGQFAIIGGSPQAVFDVSRTGKITTVATPLPRNMTALFPAPDNRSLWVTGNPWNINTPGITLGVAADGTVTTVFRVHLAAMDTDGRGNAIALESRHVDHANLLEISPFGITTLYSISSLFAQGGAIDLASGDFVAVGRQRVVRFALSGPRSVTTVLTTGVLCGNNDIHCDPGSGDFIGCAQIYNPAPVQPIVYKLSLARGGSITTVATGGTTLGRVTRPEWDPVSQLFLIPSTAANLNDVIYTYDPRTNALVTSIVFGSVLSRPRIYAASVAVASGRNLWAAGEPWPGHPFSLGISSPSEPLAPYIVGLSFGFRPGIMLPDRRRIQLNPDALFAASLANSGPFSGFQGTLNSKGEAAATVQIPRLAALSGVRFYAVAITISGRFVSTISEPVGVTIR